MLRPLLLGSLISSLFASGCGTVTPPANPPGSPPSAAASTPVATSARRSAFVVLTAGETIIIPTDATLAVERLPGHWVGALPVLPPAAWGRVPVELTTRLDARLPSLPVCPAGDFNAPCELEVTTLVDDRHQALAEATGTIYARVEVAAGQPPRSRLVSPREEEEACTCVVVHGISTDGLPLDPHDPDEIETYETSGHYSMEEYIEACGLDPVPELGATAYFGGMLYENGPMHNGMCDGLNLYYGEGRAVPLRPEAPEQTAEFPPPVGCERGVSLTDLDLDRIEAAGFPCEADEQMLGYALHRGRLVRTVGSNMGPEETDCSCASWLPASPALCPSPFDPCGQGLALPNRDAWKGLWATTDEALVLAVDADGVAVLASGNATPIRRVPAVGRILGVEHHPDTALLGVEPPPQEVRVSIPARHETDATFEGSAKAWGNRCYAHLRAERLDAAEAACFAGLLEGGTNGTRGALTYNLGRIAEARGDRNGARAYYEPSQRLRPHDATAERLSALGGT